MLRQTPINLISLILGEEELIGRSRQLLLREVIFQLGRSAKNLLRHGLLVRFGKGFEIREDSLGCLRHGRRVSHFAYPRQVARESDAAL